MRVSGLKAGDIVWSDELDGPRIILACKRCGQLEEWPYVEEAVFRPDRDKESVVFCTECLEKTEIRRCWACGQTYYRERGCCIKPFCLCQHCPRCKRKHQPARKA